MKNTLRALALLAALVFAPSAGCAPPTTGQFLFQRKTAGPFEQFGVTPITGQAFGWNGSAVVMLETGGGGGTWGSITGTLSNQIDLQNALNLKLSLSSLGTGVATFLGTPSSANLRAAITDETGTGALVFAGGNIGAATATSLNGLFISSAGDLNLATVTAELTIVDGSVVTVEGTGTLNIGAGGTLGALSFITPGTGVATFLGTPSSANLRAAVTDETGTGALVFAGGNIGAATATTFAAEDINVGNPALGAGNLVVGSYLSVGTGGNLIAFNGDNGQLRFGGETNAFPAIKRNGAALSFHLADDSGPANISTGEITLNSNATLIGEAANVLALRNGENGQRLNLYNTYTNGSNWERLNIAWSGNTLYLNTDQGGSGVNRNLWLGTNGTGHLFFGVQGDNRWYVDGSTGAFKTALDNAFDIGASGVNRPRDLYISRDIITPAVKTDADATAGNTRFFLYDVDNGTLERVTVGAADSGGAGFKVLRIPN